MITRIVGFGDSWIYGNGLLEYGDNYKADELYRKQNCLIGQLADYLGICYNSDTVKNFGNPGGSLQSTQWDFAQWAMQETDFSHTLIIVGLTFSSRQSWWHYKCNNLRQPEVTYVHNHTVHKHHPWEDFAKFSEVHANDKSLWPVRYYLTTEFFGNWAIANKVKLAMFNIFPSPLHSPHVTHPDWNMCDELTRFEYAQGNVTAPCSHPNKKGYQLLAKHLFEQLKYYKIA